VYVCIYVTSAPFVSWCYWRFWMYYFLSSRTHWYTPAHTHINSLIHTRTYKYSHTPHPTHTHHWPDHLSDDFGRGSLCCLVYRHRHIYALTHTHTHTHTHAHQWRDRVSGDSGRSAFCHFTPDLQRCRVHSQHQHQCHARRRG